MSPELEKFLLAKEITLAEWETFSKTRKKKLKYAYARRKFDAKFKKYKEELWEETNGECVYCAQLATEDKKTIEHIIPLASSGLRMSKTNLLPACGKCNNTRPNSVTPCLWAKSLKYFFYILKKEIVAHKRFKELKG